MGGSASIRGRVVDDRGGILLGATVTLTNDATGWSATVLSDRNGGFQFAALPGGSYSLTTELSGFAPRFYTGIPVSDGKSDAYEISLELSTVSETITIAGETPPRLSFRAGDEEGIGARVPGRASSTPAGARRWLKPVGVVIPESGKLLTLTGALPPCSSAPRSRSSLDSAPRPQRFRWIGQESLEASLPAGLPFLSVEQRHLRSTALNAVGGPSE